MSQNIKIFIAIPTLEGPKTENSACITTYWGEHKYPSMLHYFNETYIHMARNQAMKMASEAEATHLLFIDSDMTFPKWAVDKLIEDNKQIVGGLYFGRRTPLPIAFEIDKEINMLVIKKDVPQWKEPYEVDAIGTGFLMIRTDVFSHIQPPFFSYGNPKDFELATKPFPANEVGEDIYFCLKAKKAGLKVWCDPSIPIGHVGKRIYTRDDYEAYHKNGHANLYTEKIY